MGSPSPTRSVASVSSSSSRSTSPTHSDHGLKNNSSSSSKRKRSDNETSRSHRHSSSRSHKSSSHRRSRSRSPSHRRRDSPSSSRRSSTKKHKRRSSRDSSLDDRHRHHHSSSSRHRDRDRDSRHRSSRGDSRERRSSRHDDSDRAHRHGKDSNARNGESSDRRRHHHRSDGDHNRDKTDTHDSRLPEETSQETKSVNESIIEMQRSESTPQVSQPVVSSNADNVNPVEIAPATRDETSDNLAAPPEDEEDEKIRQRKERIEQWKRERAAKEAAEKKRQEEQATAAVASSQPALNSTQLPGKVVPSFGFKKPQPIGLKNGTLSKPLAMGKSKPMTKTMSFSLKVAPAEKTEILKPSAAVDLLDAEDDDSKAQNRSKRLRMIKLDFANDTTNTATADTSTENPVVSSSTDDAVPMEIAEEADPLEAFMQDVHGEVKRIREEDIASGKLAEASGTMNLEQVAQVNENWDADDTDELDESRLLALAASKVAVKKKDLAVVDHSQMQYESFRKNFYIEPAELAAMTDEEVDQKRLDLDGIKIRGVDCPKPIEKWTQFGMPPGALEVIRKVLKYERPSPIQAQAIPAIVSGRDVIGIAKTGSGKTIAFLLPMFRHIKDQRPIETGEGPVALIMTPTRELAVQIHKECKHFTKVLNLRAVCCYGGAPIKDQIAELKRGAEVIICTPGRMIDLLCANSGKVTNLSRVTYLVLDEADRMFDMGFEPQVMKMVKNIRPDRQTVLFSATFPRRMEALARKILQKPLEITVGARSVVAPDITQVVEIHSDDESKYHRLLEILGILATNDPNAKVLIFVDRQEAADSMLVKLLRRGYPCLSLHGGKDQADRESTISDFKSGTAGILIATSIAARGLDVKELKVVVNYECPNHLEDYVHRAGRTGRAGNKGTCYTFITPEQDKFAPDIIKALTMSGVAVPQPLQELVDGFLEKIKQGTARYSSSGFGGKGLEMLEEKRDVLKQIQKKSMGGEFADDVEDEEEEQQLEEVGDDFESGSGAVKSKRTSSRLGGEMKEEGSESTLATAPVSQPSESSAAAVTDEATSGLQGLSEEEIAKRNLPSSVLEALKKIHQAVESQQASRLQQQQDQKKQAKTKSEPAFSFEFVINDFPSKARYRITRKEQIMQLAETTGCAITTRGVYVPEGKQPPPGERKLYLVIEGDSELAIKNAKAEIQRIIVDATVSSMESEASGGGRYSVL